MRDVGRRCGNIHCGTLLSYKKIKSYFVTIEMKMQGTFIDGQTKEKNMNRMGS